MRTSKKIIPGIFFIICSLVAPRVEAQWYGQIHYKHDSTILSSAKRTFQHPGYVMAGFRPVRQVGSTSADFVIDKVSSDGLFTNPPTDFSMGYQILADPANCNAPVNVNACEGVTIIETNNQGLGETYAIAGEYYNGIFFATLDAFGNVISQNFWPFPTASVGNDRKPVIRESVSAPGTYYICGNYFGYGYVMLVNSVGAPLWGNRYNPPYMEPRDLIESPYNPNELIVVGRADFGGVNVADGFFMSLDAGTGNVNYINDYNLAANSDDWFSCIELATSPTGGSGYVLGGRALNPGINPTYAQWMCKLDPTGNPIWNVLIQPGASIAGFLAGNEINRVYERVKSNGTYEYYGVAGSYYYIQSGVVTARNNLVVFKLDDNGSNTLLPNEFHYLGGGNAPSSPSPTSPYTFSDLTAIETGGGLDDGLQAFGTDLPNQAHYFVKAYFNGVSGCKEDLTDIDNLFAGPTLVGNQNIQWNVIADCPQGGFALKAFALHNNLNTVCYASSASGGSNARHALGIASVDNGASLISVYPNPIRNKATVWVPSSVNGPVSIIIFNNLGQKVLEYNSINTSTGEFLVDFAALGIKSGFYSVQITAGSVKSNYKVIYEPE